MSLEQMLMIIWQVMPQYADSFDKIVNAYFSSVCRESFTYKKQTHIPRHLWVRQNLFRGYTCPSHCGGCCPRFSLDYLPSEYPKHESVQPVERVVRFNEADFILYSDMQRDHNNHHCRNLNMTDGRCNIHGQQPFSCDFELIRFDTAQVERLVTIEAEIKKEAQNQLSLELFGRAWQLKRMDGTLGARCEILPETKETRQDSIRKLKRLKMWTDYFNLKTCLPCIIDWAENGIAQNPDFLFIPSDKVEVQFTRIGPFQKEINTSIIV